jgi:hypothetical protein
VGTLEEGVTTYLYECDLVSWSREVTSLLCTTVGVLGCGEAA